MNILKTPFSLGSRLVLSLSLCALCLLLVCTTSSSAWATTSYAADDCRIIMRRGPKTSYKIVQMLKIGEEMEILETNTLTGWDKVRTKLGIEGWVLHRFTSPTPPPEIQFEHIKEAKQQAEKERNSLRIEVDKLRKQARSQEKLEAELLRIRKISQNTLEIEKKNETLSQKVRHMEEEMTRISDDNRILERQSDTSFFLAGATVLIVGLVSGAVLSRRRRTSPFGSLQ